MADAPPRLVDTPERAAAYARSLNRGAARMDRLMRELPGYWDDLPPEARAELALRLDNLGARLREFVRAR